ncbi:MAG: hypothetical protein CMH62_00685 [Nanoarchaeota archaeon]|nr:hypothetical protein [Nanoarchaeota archaeon]|tara:strand:+ start:2518 stop:2715 length:198 start_codon:yes stop_codon:yes gene_type:complete
MDVGDLVDRECKTCEQVTQMRYDGRTWDEEWVSVMGDEELRNLQQYTCQTCYGSFNYKEEIKNGK